MYLMLLVALKFYDKWLKGERMIYISANTVISYINVFRIPKANYKSMLTLELTSGVLR